MNLSAGCLVVRPAPKSELAFGVAVELDAPGAIVFHRPILENETRNRK